MNTENNNIYLKGIIFEDFVNYKRACMTLEMPYCTFKCNIDASKIVCQNYELDKAPIVEANMRYVICTYLNNLITHAIVFQGLEPFYRPNDYYDDDDSYAYDSYLQLLQFITLLRNDYNCEDPVIIYTGYTEEECESKGFLEPLRPLSHDGNIIIKFGRYIPDQESHLDELLGVKLASSNQYAKAL